MISPEEFAILVLIAVIGWGVARIWEVIDGIDDLDL